MGRRGQALVEFALVLALLLAMLMGIFDLGRALYQYNVAANVAREGARVASSVEGQNMTEAEIAAVALSRAPGMESTLAVTVNPPAAASRRTGQPITVTAQFGFVPITPFVPGPFTLRSRAVLHAE